MRANTLPGSTKKLMGVEERALLPQVCQRCLMGPLRRAHIRLPIGCFGHYASLRNYDANLSRHEKAGEWLVTFDLISASMYGDADFTLAHYLPYFLVPFYPLFQERGGERVERNQADWDVRPFSTPTYTLSAVSYISLRDTASADDEEQRGDIQVPLSWLAYRSCAPRGRLQASGWQSHRSA
jgi:hypothetical protein